MEIMVYDAPWEFQKQDPSRYLIVSYWWRKDSFLGHLLNQYKLT